ncbi:MAG: right-handed parallel beta-helix repeat-containing protein [Phycisphaera sp.]|nr:MAG: right-handed parallel beta-helix repeat-containing protein [Phycisphaera sp.]
MTWTAAGSPYRVVNLIIVGDDATLTIEPGVTVEFGDGLGMDIGSSAFGAGTLIARGTEAEPVVFKALATDPIPGQWRGIHFTPLAVDGQVDLDTGAYLGGSILEHVDVSMGGGPLGIGASVYLDLSVAVLKDLTARQSGSRGVRAELEGELRLHAENLEARDNAGLGMSVGGGRWHEISGFRGIANSTEALNIFDADDVLVVDSVMEGRTGSRGLAFSRCNRVVIESSRIEQCDRNGLAITDCTDVDLVGCSVLENGWAGATISRVENLTITDSDFRRNSSDTFLASSSGMFLGECNNVVIERVVLEDNMFEGPSAFGGVITLHDSERIRLIDVRFEGNTSVMDCGGLLVDNCPDTIVSDSVFVGNTAAERGGAVLLRSPGVVFEATTFEDNMAADGGAVFIDVGSTGTTFAGDPDARRFNVFTDNVATRGQDVFNGQPFDTGGSSNIDASNVCWGTLDQFEVQQRIWDGFDDPFLGFIVANPLADCDACRADIDGDGELTIFDFLGFQNAFDAGDLTVADFDGDGVLTIFDFLAFQNEFDAGCP